MAGSDKEVGADVGNTLPDAADEAVAHDPDFLAFVAAVHGPPDPVQSHVSLAVVHLLVAPAQHQHVQPLEQAKELVYHQQLQVYESPQLEVARRGNQPVYDGCVAEEEAV